MSRALLVLFTLVVVSLPARGEPMTQAPPASTVEAVKDALVRAEGLDRDNLQITLLDGANVPGVAIFRCRLARKQGKRGGFLVGVLAGATLTLDDGETLNLVARAWGLPKHKVAATEVARVFGFLEGVAEPAYPVVVAADIEALADPKWKPHVYLPRTATIDGHPAYEYWNRDGRPPLWRAQALLLDDGTVEMRRQSIGQLLQAAATH